MENKELLLKDLCARLSYGVKVLCLGDSNHVYNLESIDIKDNEVYISTYEPCYSNKYTNIESIRPYLFPLSSMTEEQKKEISKRYNYHNSYQLCVEITKHLEGYWDNDNSCDLQDYLWLEDWFNKNHFDYRGLIEKGLAIDATNKNIY